MKSFLITFCVISVLLTPIWVLAAPGIPHQFFGTVDFSNGPAPTGLEVTAKIDEESAATATVSEGKYGYNPIFYVPDPDNNRQGETINFFVNGIDTGETYVFKNGASTNLNLAVEVVESEPEPSPPPASGGGGDTYTPPIFTSELSEAAQAVDANNDDKIDVLDFNTLMVNWGSTAAGNLADFDNNNKVDIFDFNLLMIHWVNL
ncbi:MAG: hypothetical protein ACKKMP_03250 [Candidatus Nealsonbacteria bacterium]